jgi:lysophospholipase L1-like esterase
MFLILTPVRGQTTAPSVEPADVAAPKLGKDGNLEPKFKRLHEQFLVRRTSGPIDVLFLGDSITENWGGRGKDVWAKTYGDMNPANFGIGGDKTQHVLWRIDNGELDGISPKVLVLMIGTNNVPGDAYSAEDILNADTKIVQEIRQKLPNTKILLLAIFPRGADPTDPKVIPLRAKIKTVNEGLAKLDDGSTIRYLDIGDKFLDADGNLPKDIMPDALHPNAKGYQIWADSMAPLLAEMLKQ